MVLAEFLPVEADHLPSAGQLAWAEHREAGQCQCCSGAATKQQGRRRSWSAAERKPLMLPRWFNGVTQKCRFGFATLFLLLQPKNAFFHRDCPALRSLSAKTMNISGLGKAGSKLD